MKALLLTWDLSGNDPEVFEELRRYIARESWQRYASRKELRQKVWFTNDDAKVFGAFYLWETSDAMEEEIRMMYRVQEMTGVAPRVISLDVEAIQEGIHADTDLRSLGRVWADQPPPET